MKTLSLLLFTISIVFAQTQLQQGTSGTNTGIWFDTSTGNVGIGTSVAKPSKLWVEGDMQIVGYFTSHLLGGKFFTLRSQGCEHIAPVLHPSYSECEPRHGQRWPALWRGPTSPLPSFRVTRRRT